MIETQTFLFSESDIKQCSPLAHTAAIEDLPLSNPAPRLKYVNRDQLLFRTVRIDKLIDDKHPARAIW